MGEIFSAFGVDARLIVIQIVNFALLLIALWYFLYTPVLNLLEERRKKVEKGVKDAEAAEHSLQEAEESKNKMIADAHHKSEEITKQSEKHAQEKKEEIKREAEKEAESIIKNAEKQSAERSRRMQSEAEHEIAEAAILAAEKILLKKNRS